MEYLKIFVFLICVAPMMHVTAASTSSESEGSKTSSKADCGGPPPTPANGVVTGSNYLQGDMVTYSCNDGYELEGQSTSTCQSNRTWDNTDSICRAVCSNPSELQASTAPRTLVSHCNYSNSNYDNNMDSFWVIEASEGYTIDFSIKEIEIENNVSLEGNDQCFDFLEVFDGRYDTDTKLGKYCGSTVPGAILSTGRYLLVHFSTDISFVFKGFLAEYKEGGLITI